MLKKPKQSAYDRAVHCLAIRAHGTQELRTKLRQKGFDEVATDHAMLRLQAHGYLDDRDFCAQYVRARARRGYGPVKIGYELKTRGIAPDLIDAALQAVDHTWSTQIEQVWTKKFGPPVPVDRKEKAKQYRFLQYRGFTSEQIQTLL